MSLDQAYYFVMALLFIVTLLIVVFAAYIIAHRHQLFFGTRVLPGVLEQQVRQELDQWSEALGIVSERLLDLEREFSSYLDDARPVWTGSSAELDQEAADEVNRLFVMVAKAQAIVSDANTSAKSTEQQLVNVLHGLREAQVVIQAGEVEPQRRLSRPLTHAYQATSAELRTDLNGAYERTLDSLQRATSLMVEVDLAIQRVTGHGEAAQAAIARRHALGYPDGEVVAQFEEAQAALLRTQEVAATDPQAALAELPRVASRLFQCEQRAQRSNSELERVQAAFQHLDHLGQQLQRLRDDGYLLDDPRFYEDLEPSNLTQVAEALHQALDTMDETEAAERVAGLQVRVDMLRGRIDQAVATRDNISKRLVELTALRDACAARAPRTSEILAELELKHPQAALTAAEDVKEFDRYMREVAESFASIERALADRHLLAAAEGADLLEVRLTEQRDRLDALEALAPRLDEAYDNAAIDQILAEKLLAEAAALRTADGVPDVLDRSLHAQEKLATSVRALHEHPFANWLNVAESTRNLVMEVESLLLLQRMHVRNFTLAKARHAELVDEVDALLQRAEAETRDRPHIEAAIHGVRATLQDLADHFVTPRPEQQPSVGGNVLIAWVDNARKALDAVQRNWTQELDLIEAATTEVAAMNRLADAVQAQVVGFHTRPDTALARDRAIEANEALNRKAYEDAVRDAISAKSLLQQAMVEADAHDLD